MNVDYALYVVCCRINIVIVYLQYQTLPQTTSQKHIASIWIINKYDILMVIRESTSAGITPIILKPSPGTDTVYLHMEHAHNAIAQKTFQDVSNPHSIYRQMFKHEYIR